MEARSDAGPADDLTAHSPLTGAGPELPLRSSAGGAPQRQPALPSSTPFLSSLGPVAPLVVMAVVHAETGLLVGFSLPGDSLLFTAGLLTAWG